MHDFTINGRYLSQNITGVQRYAHEITKAIAEEVSKNSNFDGTIMSPPLQRKPDPASYLRHITATPFKGHIWEQTTLPAKAKGLIVNLCNSGPLVKTRQITCIHGANTFLYPDSYGKSFRLSQKILLHGMGRLSSYVTTVSQASADLLYDLKIVPKGKTIVIAPNGHEHALSWKPELSTISETFKFDRPFVLLIGSRSPHKNMKLITSLAQQLDNAGIDIAIAGGSFKVFSSGQQDVDEKNIKRLGYISDDDLAFLLSKALCFVFPSLIEGFGLPLVEAMAIGCPIVSSNTASMPEVCGDAAILIDPTRSDRWLEAICSLKDSDQMRQDLINKGKIQMKKFSWRESGQVYVKLIGSL